MARTNRSGDAASNVATQKHHDTGRRGHCISGHRHQSERGSRLGDDSVMFFAPFHVGSRKTGKIWPTTILCGRPDYRL